MRFLILCILLLLPIITEAQVVRGRVVDAGSGQAIKIAQLELLDDRQKTLLKIVADTTGAFRLRAWQAGKYAVRVGALGYQSVTSELLEVGTGEEFELNIRLSADAIPVEAVTVVARSRPSLTEIALRGYYDRRDTGRRIGMGRFFDRSEINQRGTKLSDVVRKVPGFRVFVRGRCVYFATATNPVHTGKLTDPPVDGRGSADCSQPPTTICVASMYLDGMLVKPDAVSLDQLVPLDWVEAIEAYRRPSELPAEFMQNGSCGVIALWTRRG